jgi:hypothetical protein
VFGHFDNFVTGTGPALTIHGPNDPMTQQMMTSPGVALARLYYRSPGYLYPEPIPFRLVGGSAGEWKPFGIPFMGVDGLLSSANLTRQFVGSYNITVLRGPGNRVNFYIENTTSFTSLSYQLGLPSWERNQFRLFGNTRQLFYWTELAR